MTGLQAFLDNIRDTLGEHIVSTEKALRCTLSLDIFPNSETIAAAVIRPQNEESVTAILKQANTRGVKLRIRGGGFSYTGGYSPQNDTDVLLDLRSLDTIHEINTDDLVATVGAGCTWEKLLNALREKGLDTLIQPPVSGSHSTIGGAISQGLPGDMSGVLSLGMVMPDGETLVTGSAGTTPGRLPFNRHSGPDFTGLFIGDCGVYGVKTRVSLRLRKRPARSGHATILFKDLPQLTDALRQIGASGLTRRCMGLDPVKSRTAIPATLGERLAAARSIGKSAGILELIKVGLASLRPETGQWTLHITVEGESRAMVQEKLAAVRRLCKNRTGETAPAIPRALYAQPFSIRATAGRNGESWVPVHGIVAPSRAKEAANMLNNFQIKHAKALQQQNTKMGLLVSTAGAYVLFEPMFEWPGTLSPMVAEALGKQRVRKFTNTNIAKRDSNFVRRLRQELRDEFANLDATFIQQGRFYPYSKDDNGLGSLASLLRKAIDPAQTTNDGLLGL